MWLPVPNFEDYYEVSDTGEVRSINRTFKGYNGLYHLKGKELRKSISVSNGKKYYTVTLSKNRIPYRIRVHTLVAIAYIGDPTGKVVNHLDKNTLNNHRKNIELCSQRENATHGKIGVGKTSLYPGVSWIKGRNRWGVFLWVNGKNNNLGSFVSEVDAFNRYKEVLKNSLIKNKYVL